MAAVPTNQQLAQELAAHGAALRALGGDVHTLGQRVARVEATLVDFNARLAQLEFVARPPAPQARLRLRGKQAPSGPYQTVILRRPAAALPWPWQAQWSPTYQQVFYWHPTTGASVWERPRV